MCHILYIASHGGVRRPLKQEIQKSETDISLNNLNNYERERSIGSRECHEKSEVLLQSIWNFTFSSVITW